MTKITTIQDVLKAIHADLYRTWEIIGPDVGYCNGTEAAELIVDRLTGAAGTTIETLIAEHGYSVVLRSVANLLFG